MHRSFTIIDNMKWITSTDIRHWADRRESQGLLPELIIRLIRATSKDVNTIKFPCGDAIHLSGWDGVLDSSERIYNVSSGISLWECGVNSNPKDKADKDYSKRVNDSLGYNKQESTFVFVTPRVWDGATAWANDKRQNKEWKDIVVITAVELEDWLFLCPAVALWLASKISGKSINKVQDLESFWNKWAYSKEVRLEPKILLVGREKEQQEMYNSISNFSVAIIQSIAQSESLAFAVACILESQDNDNLLSRAIVVEDEEVLEHLINQYTNIVFIVNVGHKNHTYALQNGHSIIYAASAAESFNTTPNAKLIQLPLLDRKGFIESLVNSGIDNRRAEQLSRETARNITILRRTLGIDYTCPEWAKPENIREIIPAIMVARWSEALEGDKELISLIAGESYDSYIDKLHKWLHKDDSPVVTLDGKWRLYSPYEAFGYAASYITTADFTNYKEAINRITYDNDPDAIEKMSTTDLRFWEHKQNYSGWAKEGLFQTAILISLMDNKGNLNLYMSPSEWIDRLISTILDSSTIEWWYSNKFVLGLIAEASPRSYIKFIQNDLMKEDSIIKRLFTPKGVNNLWGPQEDYTHILFSLQAMLWEEEWLLPISCILADLSRIENDSNLYNKPITALYEAYAIWRPQTYAKTPQRLQALETIAKKYPKQAFDIYFKLIDRLDHATVSYTHPMKWRCYNYSYVNVSQQDICDSITHLCKLIISVCDCSEEQICKMLNLADQLVLGSSNRQLLFEYVIAHKDNFIGNFAITNALRHSIYRHTTYADTDWALSNDEIDRWKSLLSMLEPENLLERYRWIFEDSHVDIVEVDKQHLDWKDAFEQIRIYKHNAITEIEQLHGFEGVCQFAKMVKSPNEVGVSYAYSANDDTYKRVLNILLYDRHEAIINFTKGFFSHYTFRNGINSIIPILWSLDFDKYKEVFVIPMTVMPCACREMWNFIDTLPKDIQNEYWTNITVGFIYEDESVFLIKKLIEYKRYDKALAIISHSYKKTNIPADVIEETIIGIINIADRNVLSGMQYELAKVVYLLDKREDVNLQTLYSIEVLLYKLLEHHGNINDTQFIKEIMSNPESLMEIIDKTFLSSDENERAAEIEQVKNDNSYALLGWHIFYTLRQTPFVDSNNTIDEVALNNYIDQLQSLGNAKHKIKSVNTVIGELLGNYPETEDYPPIPICDIIERLNNKEVNNGFRTRLYNKRGVTVRPAYEGGTLEKNEADKYKKYADKIRYTHPIVCSIFDDLSRDYYQIAKNKDIRVKIEKMEF